MKVRELVKKLQAVEDQNQEIWRWDGEWGPEAIADVNYQEHYQGRDEDDKEVYDSKLCIVS